MRSSCLVSAAQQWHARMRIVWVFVIATLVTVAASANKREQNVSFSAPGFEYDWGDEGVTYPLLSKVTMDSKAGIMVSDVQICFGQMPPPPLCSATTRLASSHSMEAIAILV